MLHGWEDIKQKGRYPKDKQQNLRRTVFRPGEVSSEKKLLLLTNKHYSLHSEDDFRSAGLSNHPTLTIVLFKNYRHPDDYTGLATVTPGFKPFTTLTYCSLIVSDINSFLTSLDFGLWTIEAFAKVISRYNARRRSMSMFTPCSSVSYTRTT